ncbi:MAG: PepSY1/2 domain-containing protein [Christensenellales bacterium]|jgi:spore germination protein
MNKVYREKELSQRRKIIHLTTACVVLSFLVIGIAAWGIVRDDSLGASEARLENMYSRSFMGLNDNISGMETTLAKLSVTSSPDAAGPLLEELRKYSSGAQDGLAQMPGSLGRMNGTVSLLNRIGDYGGTLSGSLGDIDEIGEDDMKQIGDIWNYSKDMKQGFLDMNQSFQNGDLTWKQLMAMDDMKDDEELPESLSGLNDLETASTDFPELVYDGPFSESRLTREPKALSGATEVTQDQAMAKARQFVPGGTLEYGGSMKGLIPAHIITFERNGLAGTLLVCQIGGEVLAMTAQGREDEGVLSLNDCINRAMGFLDEQGYKNMSPTYSQMEENMAVINTAPTQNGVVMYPDMVKVKVCRSTGDIIGFEAWNYLMNNQQREIPRQPKLSKQEAEAKVNSGLEIESTQLCVIPKDNGAEPLCWEVTARKGDQRYLVYINAENGRQEQIMMLVDSENGSTVM